MVCTPRPCPDCRRPHNDCIARPSFKVEGSYDPDANCIGAGLISVSGCASAAALGAGSASGEASTTYTFGGAFKDGEVGSVQVTPASLSSSGQKKTFSSNDAQSHSECDLILTGVGSVDIHAWANVGFWDPEAYCRVHVGHSTVGSKIISYCTDGSTVSDSEGAGSGAANPYVSELGTMSFYPASLTSGGRSAAGHDAWPIAGRTGSNLPACDQSRGEPSTSPLRERSAQESTRTKVCFHAASRAPGPSMAGSGGFSPQNGRFRGALPAGVLHGDASGGLAGPDERGADQP